MFSIHCIFTIIKVKEVGWADSVVIIQNNFTPGVLMSQIQSPKTPKLSSALVKKKGEKMKEELLQGS